MPLQFRRNGIGRNNRGNAMAAKLRVVPKPATPDDQPSESEKLDSQGAFCALKGDLDGALEVFQKAFEIREADYLADSSLENLKDISVSCNRLAEVSQEMGQLKKAFHFYSKSLKIDETLVQKNPSLQNRRDVAADWLRFRPFQSDGKAGEGYQGMPKSHSNGQSACKRSPHLPEPTSLGGRLSSGSGHPGGTRATAKSRQVLCRCNSNL